MPIPEGKNKKFSKEIGELLGSKPKMQWPQDGSRGKNIRIDSSKGVSKAKAL